MFGSCSHLTGGTTPFLERIKDTVYSFTSFRVGSWNHSGGTFTFISERFIATVLFKLFLNVGE